MSEHKQSEQEWAGTRPSTDERWPAQTNMSQHEQMQASTNKCGPARMNLSQHE